MNDCSTRADCIEHVLCTPIALFRAADIEELVRTPTSGQIAGMIAEPIQGVGGFITPPQEYFTIAAETIRKYDLAVLNQPESNSRDAGFLLALLDEATKLGDAGLRK